MAVFENSDQGFAITGLTTADLLIEVTLAAYSGPEGSSRYFYDGRYPSGDSSSYIYIAGGSTSINTSSVSGVELDGAAITTLATTDISGGEVLSWVASAHNGDLVLFNRFSLNEPVNLECTQVTIKTADGVTTLHTYDLSNPTQSTIADGTGSVDGELLNFSFSPGPSITAADDITSEGQTVTVTLSGNAAAPTSATLNGTDVGTLTDQGSGVYSYDSPLIADDDTADLVVSVDGTTAGATIAYANSYDRDQLTHPATEAEYSENSLSYPNAYATTQAYEWKVIADANASVVTINWNALEADDGFHKNVASYATPVANGSTTVTLGVFVPETGQAYQFDRTITVSDGSVVVEGEGLFRSLFSALEKSLFKPLFR